MAAERICVIFNPAAKGHKARRFLDSLKKIASEAELRPTSKPGDGRPLAAAAVRDGFETIVAAGGDGTLNEVINGIGDEPAGFEQTRLGVVPLGTVNVFARELKIPFQPDEAWELIRNGREQRIDLPKAIFQAGGTQRQQYFAQLAGAGLDSRAIARLDLQLKNRIGKFAYIWAGVRALSEDQTRITVRSRPFSGEAELVLVGNGRYYGGNFVLFPKAVLQDGLLDVTVFPRVNWTAAAGFFLGWATGRPDRAGGSIQFQTDSLSITCDQRLPIELEGDNVGDLPAEITICPGRLRVICR